MCSERFYVCITACRCAGLKCAVFDTGRRLAPPYVVSGRCTPNEGDSNTQGANEILRGCNNIDSPTERQDGALADLVSDRNASDPPRKSVKLSESSSEPPHLMLS